MASPPFPTVGRVYDATHHRTVDGDTVDVIEFRPVRLRLLGVDTPERSDHGPWASATAFTRQFMAATQTYRVQTATKDAFGRELAWVWDSTGRSLNDALIDNGHAEVYAAEKMIAAALAGEKV
jgi:endonuclease YncB( thermonuclease family)